MVPESCAGTELENGTLRQVGGAEWTAELKIQACRSREGARPIVRRMWKYFETSGDRNSADFAVAKVPWPDSKNPERVRS